MGPALSDEDILEKLREGRTNVLKYCYGSSFNKVKVMVTKNSGSLADAEDIFQEAIIIFYKNCLKPSFVLSATISTYLYSVAWRLWMKHLRDRHQAADIDQADHAVTEAFEFELAEGTSDELERVLLAMETAGKRCKEILILFYFNKLRLDQVAQKLGLKDERAVREQKYRCMKRIREEISNG